MFGETALVDKYVKLYSYQLFVTHGKLIMPNKNSLEALKKAQTSKAETIGMMQIY